VTVLVSIWELPLGVRQRTWLSCFYNKRALRCRVGKDIPYR